MGFAWFFGELFRLTRTTRSGVLSHKFDSSIALVSGGTLHRIGPEDGCKPAIEYALLGSPQCNGSVRFEDRPFPWFTKVRNRIGPVYGSASQRLDSVQLDTCFSNLIL